MYLQYVHIFKTRGAEGIWSFVNVATKSRFVATFQKYPEATFKCVSNGFMKCRLKELTK